MRYEDASGSFSSQGAGAPDARDDADALPAGSRGPATGNTITGEGTITGAAGADVVTSGPGKIVALEGAGGSDSADGGSLHVEGRFGELTMDSRGGYSYSPHAAKPEGGSDVFRYTLADGEGARDTATLTIDIGREIEKIEANAQQIIPGPDGVVTLPPGVELSDILVVGRNLVINLPDGTQMVIIDGAVFVPQLVLGGVEVPASNLAALLIDAEPKPAAGTPLSSGGNFAVDVPPLDPGVPLGDLIPPTELAFTPPIFEEVGQVSDEEPEILIQPDGQPASIAAVDSVDEAGLPTRNSGEPAGSSESADGNGADNDDPSETTTGLILIDSPDDPSEVTINGTEVTGVGQVIAGTYGNLTITSISDSAIGYSYTLRDNTSGDATHDDFSVTVTDRDGDQATATLTINIVDDRPTARPDTDSIAAGTFGPATGNLVTDSAAGDSGDGDSGADTVGADNAAVTSISGAGGSDSTFSGGVLTVNGQYGVLTVEADGDYSYVRNPNTPGGVTDTFNYTITDGDGDPSSSTLTITIADRLVTVGPNLVVRTDDDAVPGANGNPGGTGDDVDAANLTGTLSGSGGDGTLTFDLLTSGAPAGFTYVDGPGGSVLVQQGGVTVLTITVNAATGAYTVTQNAPIDHAALGDENNAEFTINYTVTDLDGDSAAGTLTINVDDDTPVITRQDVSAPTLTVDETDLATNATGNFSTLFAVSYGADGAGTTSYSVSVVNGTDSGLDDVATGQDILLFNNGGVVEGRVGGASGAIAFTVSVNSATGVVTLDQVRALEHPDATNPNDSVSPAATSIQFTVNAVDGDGDPVSQTINIGANLAFDDDGPSLTNAAAASSVLLDETTAGTPGGFPISATSASAMITATQAFGADGPAASGSAVYGLSLSGSASGLQTAIGDHAITLVQVDADTVQGQYNGTNVAFTIQMNADGTVTVTQNVPLEHVVDGPPGPAHDDPLDLGNLVNATLTITDRDGDSASAAVAIGDNIVFEDDGPSINVTAGADSGVVLTTDDAQTIGGASDTASSTANFSGVFGLTFAGGADGASTPALNYTLGVSVQGVNSGLTQGGAAIYLYVIGGEVVGSTSATQAGVSAANTVFDVSVDAGGTVTLTQFSQIDHPIGSDPSATGAPFADHILSLSDGLVTLTASATITDNDGDFATDSETVAIGANLRFTDDGPALTNVSAGPGVTLDETTAGTPAGFPISGTSASAVISATQAFGADGPAASGSVVYGLTLVGSASGLQTAIGDHAITLVQIDADTIQGQYNGTNVAFTIQMNADGTVTLTQNVPLEHVVDGGTAAAHDDALNLAGLVNATVTIKDFDGDTATASVGIGGNLVFEDDGPDAQVDGRASPDVLVLDETIPVGTETDGDSNPPGLASVQSNFANNFVSPADHGADGPGTVTYSLVLSGSNVASGLYALDPADISASDGDGYGRGAQILLNQSGNTITGSVGGVDYFTISIDPNSGIVTFTQLNPIWHSSTASDDDTSTLTAATGSLLVRQTVTDSDGDFDTADIDVSTGTFQIEDDGPVAVNDSDNVGAPGTTATGNVITDAAAGDSGDSDTGADDVGADVPGRITQIAGFGGTDTTFDGSGNLQVNGQYGVLTIKADGSYVYIRNSGTPGGVNDVFTYTLTDADGDSTTATLTITLADNRPVAGSAAATVDDDGLTGGNAASTSGDLNANVGETTPSASEAVFNGTLAGTAGDGATTFLFSSSLNGTTATVGTETVTYSVSGGGTLLTATGPRGVLFTVQITNTTTGDYTVTLVDNVLHASLDGLAGDNTENDASVVVAYQMQDADGDQSLVPGSLTITFDDDMPSAVNDTDSVGAPGSTATGNVITDAAAGDSGDSDTGADSVGADTPGTITQIQGFGGTDTTFDGSGNLQVNGQYGVLTIKADGNYVYTRNSGTPGGVNDVFTYTLTDADGDSVTATLTIAVADIRPIAGAATATVDDDGLAGGNAASTTGDLNANVGETTASASEAIYNGTLAGTAGDGATTFLFAASLTGTTATVGTELVTYAVSGGGTTLTATGPRGLLFTVQITNTATGEYTLTLADNVLHDPVANGGDNTENDASVVIPYQMQDADGDTSLVPGSLTITFDDDMPSINSVTTPLQIVNDSDPVGTGNFAFAIGADTNSDLDDITVTNFAVSVNSVPLDVSDFTFTTGVEDGTLARYSFTFTYDTGAGGTTTTGGTLVFNKSTGQYTVDLDGPVEGFSILQTAAGTLFQGYKLGTSTPDSSQPAISVTQIRGDPSDPDPTSDLFVQFTSVSEPSSGTGSNNLVTIAYDPDPDGPNPAPGDGAFVDGELFNQAAGWVSTSGSSNGVDGDTIQGGEVLDFNLVLGDNPTGILAQPEDLGQATSMFLKFDGIGTGEDLIVILKLYDTVAGTYTTKAVMIENADIIKGPRDNDPLTAAPPLPAPYQNITLDNNDGFVVIEPNDYQQGNTNLVIVGAQIAGSDEGVTGSAINLNGAVGASGGSTTTQPLSTDVNDGPFKISSIGFLTEGTTEQNATLTFDVTVEDADGDSVTQAITVNIGDTTTTTSSTASTAVVSQEPIEDTSALSLASSDSQDQQRSMSAANNNSVLLGAIAAAGLGVGTAAAAHDFTPPGLDVAFEAMATGGGDPVAAGGPVESDAAVGNGFAGETREAVEASSSGSSPGRSADAGQPSLTAADQGHGQEPTALLEGTEIEQSDPGQSTLTSAAVGMPSAEMLAANADAHALDGPAQGTAEVGRVLIDALAGGAGGPDIDALIDAVANHGPGGNAALDALASHGAAAVSGWDTAGFAGFSGGHSPITVDAMMIHPDAIVTAA